MKTGFKKQLGVTFATLAAFYMAVLLYKTLLPALMLADETFEMYIWYDLLFGVCMVPFVVVAAVVMVMSFRVNRIFSKRSAVMTVLFAVSVPVCLIKSIYVPAGLFASFMSGFTFISAAADVKAYFKNKKFESIRAAKGIPEETDSAVKERAYGKPHGDKTRYAKPTYKKLQDEKRTGGKTTDKNSADGDGTRKNIKKAGRR